MTASRAPPGPGAETPFVRTRSLWQYLSGDVLSFALIMLTTFWPVVFALLVLPALGGYLLNRRRRRGTD
jgi:hypothetical protein